MGCPIKASSLQQANSITQYPSYASSSPNFYLQCLSIGRCLSNSLSFRLSPGGYQRESFELRPFPKFRRSTESDNSNESENVFDLVHRSAQQRIPRLRQTHPSARPSINLSVPPSINQSSYCPRTRAGNQRSRVRLEDGIWRVGMVGESIRLGYSRDLAFYF